MRKSLSIMLAAALVMGTTMTAQAGLNYLIHQGNNDPLTQFGDTGMAWSNNGNLVPQSAGYNVGEGPNLQEDALQAPLDTPDGWVATFGGDAPFATTGEDGTTPWYVKFRVRWLNDFQNLYMQDGISDWNIFIYRSGSNGISGIAKSFATGEPSGAPYYEQFIDYPGPDEFHEIVMQYKPNGGTNSLGQPDGSVDFYFDGDLIRNIPRSDVPNANIIGIGDYMGFGGHSNACCNSHSYWSYFEFTGGVIPEPASLALLGMSALAMIRRRR
jgi:hypothetical protein